MKQFQLKKILEFVIFLHTSGLNCFVDGAVIHRWFQTGGEDSRRHHTHGHQQNSDAYNYNEINQPDRPNSLKTWKLTRDFLHVPDSMQSVSKQKVLLDGVESIAKITHNTLNSRVRRDADETSMSLDGRLVRRRPLTQYTSHKARDQRRPRADTNGRPRRRRPLVHYPTYMTLGQRRTRAPSIWRPRGRNNFMRVITLLVSDERPRGRHLPASPRASIQDQTRRPVRRRRLE